MDTYSVVDKDGRLVIQDQAGHDVPWVSFSATSETDIENWQAKSSGFVSAGVHLHHLSLWARPGQFWFQPFWSLDGRPVTSPRDPVTLEEQATWLLQRDAEARFIIRFSIHPDPAWRAENPDEFQPLPGRDSADSVLSINPSLASEKYLVAVDRMIRDLVAWCEGKTWRDRIVGYSIFPLGCEGMTEVGLPGLLFDESPVMQAAFKRFLRAKYRTDEDLRSAWGDEAVTLNTAVVPSLRAWHQKRQRLGLLHWPAPGKVRREQDYFLLQKELFHRYCRALFTAMADATAARPVVKGYDIFKQPLLGWLHNPNFGLKDWQSDTLDSYGSVHLASGSIGVGPLLDEAALDILQTPAMYYNRAMGYAWEAEGLSDSLVLRGKLNFLEADMRTWAGRPGQRPSYEAGSFLTPAQMRAGFDRTLAWALSRNQMFYHMTLHSRAWWYEDPVIQEKIGQQRQVIERMTTAPWRETTDAICLVIDDESPLHEDYSSGFQFLAVYRQLEEGLALCGVPYRIHLLSDLMRDDFPEYKCYLFPNLFTIDAAVRAVLEAKVLRNGQVAIFGPGTGIVSGDGLSPAAATELLGVDMELIHRSVPRRVMLQDHGHPLSRGLQAAVFGENYAYGPALLPASNRLEAPGTSAKALGTVFCDYALERQGLFIRDFGRGGTGAQPGPRGAGDYAVIFTAAVPLPPEFLREACRYAGCNIWSERNAVVYASADFVALHAAMSGEYVLRLPAKNEVRDLVTGEVMSPSTDRIEIQIQAPETRLFVLKVVR